MNLRAAKRVLLQQEIERYVLLSRSLCRAKEKRTHLILSASAVGERTIQMILELVTSEHAA